MPGVKLKHLKIHQYRNVRPGTELRFDDGINLVLGQNGSGKTTLLGLLSMVCNWYFVDLAEEEFSIEFELSREGRTTTCQIANRKRAEGPETTGFTYEYHISLGYRALTMSGTPDGLLWNVSGAGIQAFAVSPFAHDFLAHLIDALPRNAPDRTLRLVLRLDLVMLRLGTPYRFDEGLGGFYALTAQDAPVSAPAGLSTASLRLTLLADLTVSPPRVQITGQPHPLSPPQAVLQHIFADADSNWQPFDSTGAERIPFLSAAVELLGFADASLRPVVSSTSGPVDRRKIRIDGFDFLFKKRDGTLTSHTLLSYGQKRILAFFYYLSCNDSYVIADELVNGLHHRWIAACMEAIDDRQAFLTSQNPLLFEHVEFASIEQVETRFITCKSELVDGAEQLVWQNMPRDDAERFYRGYQADIESIGDILINRGLW